MKVARDSGEYWLGMIPSSWEMPPAWVLFSEGRSKCTPTDPHLVPSRVYGVVTRDELVKFSGNKPVDNEASASNMKHVEPHDFIISMGSHETGIEHSRQVGKVSNDYRVLRPTGKVNPEYYKWFFKSKPLIEGLRGLTTEIRVGQRIHYSRFSLLRLPLPPLETQKRIADYLDRETAEIDAAVADLDKYVELLEKRRLLFISKAVAPFEVRHAPLKLDCKFVTSGSRGWAQYYAEKGTRFIRIADLQRGHYGFRYDSPQFVNIEDNCEGTRTRTRVGDLVFSITAYLGSVGVITQDLADSFVSQHVALVRLNGRIWTPEFVAYTALGSAGQRYLTENSYGGTKSQLNLEQVQNFPVPYIPLREQFRVVDRLNSELGEIDSLISKSKKLRDLLLKRRSVLIADVVTGRKQV